MERFAAKLIYTAIAKTVLAKVGSTFGASPLRYASLLLLFLHSHLEYIVSGASIYILVLHQHVKVKGTETCYQSKICSLLLHFIVAQVSFSWCFWLWIFVGFFFLFMILLFSCVKLMYSNVISWFNYNFWTYIWSISIIFLWEVSLSHEPPLARTCSIEKEFVIISHL